MLRKRPGSQRVELEGLSSEPSALTLMKEALREAKENSGYQKVAFYYGIKLVNTQGHLGSPVDEPTGICVCIQSGPSMKTC